ncbi:MAG TPA: NUDIX domain-containing protein [Planctomycetota bacterium]
MAPAPAGNGASAPFTIVLGDGLEEEVVGPQVRHLDSRTHVGEREVERLFGRGRSFGNGPLPAFLRAALEQGEGGARVAVFLLAHVAHGSEEELVETRFTAPLTALAARATVIACPAGRVPWEDLRAAIARRTGIDPTAPDATGLRFLVVGCHTEGRVLALALFLRSYFRCEEVAISHHLAGSSIPEAHLAALRHTMPGLGVTVLLDLAAAARFAQLAPATVADAATAPCVLEPPEARDQLGPEARQIVERLCLHWTRARLRSLHGGFSGSLLLLAEGWKGEARTEPMVLKIDLFRKMRRELAGYYLIKDFLGKSVPTFGYPVSVGDWLGVGMELAAKEGTPATLQDTFQRAEDEESTRLFFRRLDKMLELLVEKLLRNTRELDWIVPYRDFGLHPEQQQHWLRENAGLVQRYLAEAGVPGESIDLDQLVTIFALITGNQNGLESEVCLAHGDLNYANVICDQGDNVWFIDWTHCARLPLELDFAKIENDAKFVMENALELADLPRLRKLEDFLLQQRAPPALEALPAELAFVKWDLRLRKLYGTVRRIRAACFSLKAGEDWTVYRIALLRYAAHTLSFDRRRGRGECQPVQLAAALHSVSELAYELFSDPFHMQIRAERPEAYPIRQRLTVDEAPWSRACPSYAPPYFVAPEVLAGHHADGWADPEDVGPLGAELARRPAEHRDAEGRPLNPSGRTGIAGRGLLGAWGANLSVAAVLVRPGAVRGELDVVLGREPGEARLELPKGFVLPGEEPGAGLLRILAAEAGLRPGAPGEPIAEAYTFDARQTDHAWVETRVFLLHDEAGVLPDVLAVGGGFDTLQWWPLNAETVNRVPSDQARFLRTAVERLAATGRLEAARARSLLARTG